MEHKYENRLVGFIDILGFKNMVYKSEYNIDLQKVIYEALNRFKKMENPNRWGVKIIEIEEDAQRIGVEKFDISNKTECTCFSDSIVISVQVGKENINEYFSTLVANLAEMGEYLLTEGILIRGAITVGNLHHKTNGIIFGSALIEAYELESKNAIYPRIIISNKLISELNYPIQKRYPYHQYLDRFDDGCVGFHQMSLLQVIQNSDVIPFDQVRTDLETIRKVIIKGLDSNFESLKIYSKYNWMKEQYRRLIIFEDDKGKKLIKEIHDVSKADSRQNIHFNYIDNMMNKE